MNSLYVTILAGGLGTRMCSDLPKVLHKVKGISMINRLIQTVQGLDPHKVIIVVGQYEEQIRADILTCFPDNHFIYARQQVPLGTGDAVKSTVHLFPDNCHNLILNGDVPMLKLDTIKSIYDRYISMASELMITGIHLEDPTGNGRILTSDNSAKCIIEEKDCTDAEKLLTLVNTGIYIVCSSVLRQYIPLIDNHNSKLEYYLTDLVKIYREQTSKLVDLTVLPSEKQMEIFNVNTRMQLQQLNDF